MLILNLVFCLHFHFKGSVDSLVFILIQNESKISKHNSFFWSWDNNSLSRANGRCRLIPAHRSTSPGAVGNMTLETAPSHLTSGAMLTLSLLPSHFIVPDGEEKRILWQLIKCQDLFLSLAVFYSQLGKCLFSPQQHWLEPGLQVKTLAQWAVWLWVCDTPHTPRASPEPTQGWGFTAGPPLPIHVNDSFILDFRELRLSPTHHPAGNSVSTRIWLTDSPAASVTHRCHKQGQHSSDHTRMSENAHKEEREEMMLNDLQRVRHYGEPVKSKR